MTIDQNDGVYGDDGGGDEYDDEYDDGGYDELDDDEFRVAAFRFVALQDLLVVDRE